MKNKKIIISIAIFLGIMIITFTKISHSDKGSIDIPKKNEVSFIEIYDDYISDISKYHVIESDKDIEEIYDILLSAKRKKNMQSDNDSPTNVNGEVTKIVIKDSANNEIILFVYKRNYGKFYIERPYEGIYEISNEEYDNLIQYFK